MPCSATMLCTASGCGKKTSIVAPYRLARRVDEVVGFLRQPSRVEGENACFRVDLRDHVDRAPCLRRRSSTTAPRGGPNRSSARRSTSWADIGSARSATVATSLCSTVSIIITNPEFRIGSLFRPEPQPPGLKISFGNRRHYLRVNTTLLSVAEHVLVLAPCRREN